MNDDHMTASDPNWPFGALNRALALQRKQSSSGLTIMFSKLVTMTASRSSLLRMVFDNCNPLIYCAAITAI